MPSAPEPSLTERRLLLRAQLRAQRECIALQLAAGIRGGYPRSITMRLLLYRPALVIGLVSVLAGRRVGGVVHALTVVVGTLAAFTEAPDHRPRLPSA